MKTIEKTEKIDQKIHSIIRRDGFLSAGKVDLQFSRLSWRKGGLIFVAVCAVAFMFTAFSFFGCGFLDDCSPDCTDLQCGDDGCGGSCGRCGGDGVCHEGSCCFPDCDGRQCGDDGCGGTCGTCGGGGTCVEGICDWNNSPGNGVCNPGQTRQCTCADEQQGEQACRSDGGGWNTCVCESNGPGTENIGIAELNIGDRVVDTSWQWEFRLGVNYTSETSSGGVVNPAEVVTSPVVWIVVAKDHYQVSRNLRHVTLISENLIANHAFDDAWNRGLAWGTDVVGPTSSHWGVSGTPDASFGLRPFVNSIPKSQGVSYSGSGFLAAFSRDFERLVVYTTVPNVAYPLDDSDNTAVPYTTQDKVFIPSQTELGGDSSQTWPVGSVFPYYNMSHSMGPGELEELLVRRRVLQPANSGAELSSYYTRSPLRGTYDYLRGVAISGNFQTGIYRDGFGADWENEGVRPVLNISAAARVSASPDENGIYHIRSSVSGPEEFM